jgi:hypothetical protein
LHAKQKTGVNIHCAPQMCGGARNAMQAISPVALGDELNTGWHLNVPSRRLFLSCRFCG